VNRPGKFLALDIEADGWTRVRCVGAVTDEGEARTFRTVSAARDWLDTQGGSALAHYGSGFDFVHLLADRPLTGITYADGSIYSAVAGRTWLASFERLCADPLAKLGEWVGLPKLHDSAQLDQLSQSEVEAHCLRDCQILATVAARFLAWVAEYSPPVGPKVHFPKSGGRTATYLLECLEPELVAHLRRHPLTPAEWQAHHQAHQGGRSECWRLGYAPRVYVYDLNSSYSAGWLEGPMPIGPWRWVSGEAPGRLAVYRCGRVRQSRARPPVTLLQHAAKHEGWGYLTSEEVAAVREAGGEVVVDGGWVSEEEAPMAQKLVGVAYKAKRDGLPWAKNILNALHGKTISELTRDTYFHTPGGYRKDRTLTLPEWYQRPLIGSFIYGRARLRLGRALWALLSNQWKVFQAHTDSAHTDCPPERFPLPLGLDCGQWRLQYGPCEAVYAGPGLYALRRPQSPGEVPTREWRSDGRGRLVRVACAGFDGSAVTWEDVEAAARGEARAVESRNGLVGFRATLQGLPPTQVFHRRFLQRVLGGKRLTRGGWLAYR
jgi:hypothetical protein